MDLYPTGGMVDEGGNAYSGNDSERYTHEIAHLFSLRKFGVRPDLLEEGLATLLGGSAGHPYAWHRANLKEHLDQHPEVDLAAHCNTYAGYHINADTNVPYVVGALLCERILRRGGKAELFRLMSGGSDPWPALAAFGITRGTVSAQLKEDLLLPPVAVW